MTGVRTNALTDADVMAAIGLSPLRDLPPELLAAVTAEATTTLVHAGETIHDDGEAAPHLELVLSGLVRARVSAPDGRMLTVRYCRAGALVGAATLFAEGTRPFAIQALTDSGLLTFRPPIVRRLATQEVRVAGALLAETSTRVLAFLGELSGTAFATVRQRLARHLLDLACEHQPSRELVAAITQQELAEATGTVREVVVRVLRELRQEGVVHTGPHGITILEPERLVGAAQPQGWNAGS
jgi:CRP/FNR family transcriptional regulator, cyclic AMP receptor protein